MWFGESEANVRDVFDKVNKLLSKTIALLTPGLNILQPRHIAVYTW